MTKNIYIVLEIDSLDTAGVAEIAFHVTHENLGSPAECPVTNFNPESDKIHLHQYDLKDVILSISHDA